MLVHVHSRASHTSNVRSPPLSRGAFTFFLLIKICSIHSFLFVYRLCLHFFTRWVDYLRLDSFTVNVKLSLDFGSYFLIRAFLTVSVHVSETSLNSQLEQIPIPSTEYTDLHYVRPLVGSSSVGLYLPRLSVC